MRMLSANCFSETLSGCLNFNLVRMLSSVKIGQQQFKEEVSPDFGCYDPSHGSGKNLTVMMGILLGLTELPR